VRCIFRDCAGKQCCGCILRGVARGRRRSALPRAAICQRRCGLIKSPSSSHRCRRGHARHARSEKWGRCPRQSDAPHAFLRPVRRRRRGLFRISKNRPEIPGEPRFAVCLKLRD
jgi:hypothetical protein